jgi:hypothetical protein
MIFGKEVGVAIAPSECRFNPLEAVIVEGNVAPDSR